MSRNKSPTVVQYFSDEYLERCRGLSPQDILRFLEEYRRLFGAASSTVESHSETVSDEHLDRDLEQNPADSEQPIPNRDFRS